MWCTRWFLVLFLLPYPRASPFFLVLYLFSLILHSRPCLYCIVLLTVLFTSSCYWAPVNLPMPSFLSSTSQNSSMRTTDQRCWCDINDGHIFDPFPPVLKTSPSIEITSPYDAAVADGSLLEIVPGAPDAPIPAPKQPFSISHVSWPDAYRRVRGWLAPTARHEAAVEGSLEQAQTSTSNGAPSMAYPLAPTVDTAPWSRSWLGQRYDLREHGIDLILDFGWGRSDDLPVGA